MRKLGNRGSWSLIGLLVVVVIVVVAAAYMFGKGPGLTTVKGNSQLLDSKSKKQTVMGKSLDTARASVCLQQLGQIREGIQTYKATEGTEANPKTLKDIGLSVGQEFYKCPVSQQPYTYDPASGTVKCPTHTQF